MHSHQHPGRQGLTARGDYITFRGDGSLSFLNAVVVTQVVVTHLLRRIEQYK